MSETIPLPQIIFSNIPALITCSSATIKWMYFGPPAPTSNYLLMVTNIGVPQDVRRREYPLVPRQGPTATNMTLFEVNPALGNVDWPEVNVPPGRYRLDFYTPRGALPSNDFTVNGGVDASCLVTSSQSSIPPSSTTLPPQTTSSTKSPPVVSSSRPVVASLTTNRGVIAGSVVGGVGFLALIAALVLWVLRFRKARAHNTTPTGSVPRTKGYGSKRHHNPSDSTGAILPNFPRLSEDFGSEKSAVGYEDAKLSPAPIMATRSYSESSTSSWRPSSMAVRPSFESRETVQPQLPRFPHRSLDSSMLRPNKIIIPGPSPSPSRHPSDRARRASRKPVPAYDESEFSNSGSNDIPLASRSDSSLGKKVYHIMPDAPLEQRN